ncbi:MAG: nuclear transport factor 2 family protein [Rhodococcus sp. (in: high G+C Gram-positive bacteria)]
MSGSLPTMDSVEQVKDAERRRFAAVTAADVDALSALLSHDLVYCHSNGERDTKSSYLRSVKAGDFVYGPITHVEAEIRITGSIAVVIGAMSGEVTIRGVAKHLDNLSTAVWTKTDSTWLLSVYQTTRVFQ